MHQDSNNFKKKYWFLGFFALIWLLIRSGENPRRLTYPCQQAAFPLAVNWALAFVAFVAGNILLRKFFKASPFVILISGIVWFTVSLPGDSTAGITNLIRPPVWEVPNPISKVFVLDSIPATKGSLAVGNATVPDSFLVDPAMDTLCLMLKLRGVNLHRTSTHADGIVGSNNIVIIKGNFQWTGKVTTNTDRIKGLIWQILNHPDGFTGEIIVCDNTQGYFIDQNDNNSEDTAQSIVNVVSTFRAKGYPVFLRDWKNITNVNGLEYNQGNYNDSYIYEPSTKISYPKFRSSSGKYLISLRYGIWDSLTATYDSSRLCLINFPVLKHHGMSGATEAIKNWIGVMTIAQANERYGGWTAMHYNYLFNQYALVSRIMAVTYPRLSIVDAAWTSAAGNTTPDYVVNTKVLLASTDPVAVSWYAAKFVLTPVAYNKSETNPDLPGGKYNVTLTNWANFLRDSAGLPCTKDSTKISVFSRENLPDLPIQLLSLSAVLNDTCNGVIITWSTLSEINNYGFYVERRLADEPAFITVENSFIPGHGTTLEPQTYTFIDTTIVIPGTYHYRLRQIDTDGLVHYTHHVVVLFYPNKVTEGKYSPTVFKLSQNYPNPFNPTTLINFSLGISGYTTLKVYNLAGQEVATLFDRYGEGGRIYSVYFDAANLSSGIFYYKLVCGNDVEVRKLILLK